MAIRAGLVLKRSAGYQNTVLGALKRAGIECTPLTLKTLQESKPSFEVVILDSAATGAKSALMAHSGALPLIFDK